MPYSYVIKNQICPVCGFYDVDESDFGHKGKDTYHAICSSCGTQFGYHDCNTSHEELREGWAKEGLKWHFKDDEPKDFNLTNQLKNLKLDDKEVERLIKLSNKIC